MERPSTVVRSGSTKPRSDRVRLEDPAARAGRVGPLVAAPLVVGQGWVPRVISTVLATSGGHGTVAVLLEISVVAALRVTIAEGVAAA